MLANVPDAEDMVRSFKNSIKGFRILDRIGSGGIALLVGRQLGRSAALFFFAPVWRIRPGDPSASGVP